MKITLSNHIEIIEEQRIATLENEVIERFAALAEFIDGDMVSMYEYDPSEMGFHEGLLRLRGLVSDLASASDGNDNRKLTICDNLILTTPEPCF